MKLGSLDIEAFRQAAGDDGSLEDIRDFMKMFNGDWTETIPYRVALARRSLAAPPSAP